VAAELDLEAGLCGAPADHAVGVDPVHGPLRKHAGLADYRTEEGADTVVTDPRRGEVFVDEGLELWCAGI
jgi:hypothetical protein